MGKRCLTVLLILSLLLALTACGEVSVSSDPETSGTEQSPESGQSGQTEILWTEDVHSGVRDDGTFTEGTLFIGDSLTYGFVMEYLQRYELIGDAKYMAVVGAPLSRFFSSERLGYSGDGYYSPEFAGLTYSEAAAQMGEGARAVYLMLGTNFNPNANEDKYIEVVDYLLENCPNATVYLQLIPMSYSDTVDYETVNGYIRKAYEHYQAEAVQKVMLIDTFTAIGQGLGGDGIHLSAEGKDAWYMAILAHTKNNNIPE